MHRQVCAHACSSLLPVVQNTLSKWNLTALIFLLVMALTACGDAAQEVSQNGAPKNDPPIATDVSMTDSNGGIAEIGDTLTGRYTYSDAEGDLEGESIYRWLRDDTIIEAATELTYTIADADYYQTIRFEVTPIAKTGAQKGVPVASAGMGVGNTAPTASGVGIKDNNGGNTVVGDILTGIYLYKDIDGNAEAAEGSRYQWFRNGSAIPGATGINYTVAVADSGQALTFEVTPVAGEGILNGSAVISVSLIVSNSAPVASEVHISDNNGGDTFVGDTLTGNYIYSDADGDAQGTSIYRWLRDGVVIDGATEVTYTVTIADSGKAIIFEIIPVADGGSSGVGVPSSSVTVMNSVPVAIGVSISDGNGGSLLVGDTLTGSYIYVDADGDAEGTSSYRWLRDGAVIGGATGLSYTLTAADIEKTLVFEVTPKAASGASPGNAVLSNGLNTRLAPLLSIGFAINQLRFSWTAVSGATHYKLFQNPDGASGFTQLGGNISSTTLNVDIPVHLTDWVNARYSVQACNDGGCGADSNEVNGLDGMLFTIGYVKASNTETFDSFGYSIALSGDSNTLAVGAFHENSAATGIGGNPVDDCEKVVAERVNCASSSGAVYIFVRSAGGAWTQQGYIKASNTGTGDQFGFSIALSGDSNTLVVGARGEDSAATGIGGNPVDDCEKVAAERVNCASGSGAVYVFTRNAGSTWSQQAYVKASNIEADDLFGQSLALSGDGNTLVVGAHGEDSAATGIGGNQVDDCEKLVSERVNCATDSGAVYVFVRSGGETWAQQAYVKASNIGAGDQFGYSIALSGDSNTLAVGALLEDSAATGFGGNPVDDCAKLVAERVNCASNSGAVYIFARSTGDAWTQQAYIKASNTGTGDQFGISIALSGDSTTLAVGANTEDSASKGIGGNPVDDCEKVVAERVNCASGSGAVYIFVRSLGGAWAQQAYVKASNTGTNDLFGRSVALTADGNILAAAAIGESSAATGIGGNEFEDCAAADNCATGSGAVYMFGRTSNGMWSQQAYVKASNTGANDAFGISLALSNAGNNLAVGAFGEGSAATGVTNGADPAGTDNSVFNAGAVYLY